MKNSTKQSTAKTSGKISRKKRPSYSPLWNSVSDAVVVQKWDRSPTKWMILAVNEAATELLGYSESEFLKKTTLEIIHPEERELLRKHVRDAKKGKSPPSVFRWIRKDRECVTAHLKVVFDGTIRKPQAVYVLTSEKPAELFNKSEDHYRSFMQRSSEGIWRTDVVPPVDISMPEEEQAQHIYQYSRIAECNDAMARMLGYSLAEEITGKFVRELHLRDTHDLDFHCRFIRSGYNLVNANCHEMDRDRNERYFLVSCVGILKDGQLTNIWGTQRDITERTRAEEALLLSEERYRMLFERNMAGVFRTTPDGKILDCNDSYAQMLGYKSREEMLQQSAWNLYFSKSDRDSFLARLMEKRSLSNFELNLRRRDGSIFWGLANVNLQSLKSGISVIEGTLVDISDRKRAEQQVIHQAYHDTVTGLPNRNLLFDRLHQVLARIQRHKGGLAILFLDLDHFKLINDTLGHSVGDWLLQTIAERLKRTVRDVDTIARLGGDEFVILLPDVKHSEDAARVAQKLLESISEPLHYGSNELYITTSIGISLCPADGNDAETLIKSADNAMYRAKELGRNNYQLWSPALNRKVHERLAMENNIRRALEQGEFLLYYQPQFSTINGELRGLEALIRWQHPERGMISPREFLSVAEDSRLIIPMGEWVMREAISQLKWWQTRYQETLRLSINLSARQFQHQTFIEDLERNLLENSVDPRAVMIEITETVALDNMDHTLALLHTLRRKGIRVALDDFGMGYSSLGQLKYLPVDCIKIDPVFIKDVGNGSEEENLVRAVIQLGHSLGRSVIGEGVETSEQFEFLKKEGCEEVQGNLLMPAQPSAEVEKNVFGDK